MAGEEKCDKLLLELEKGTGKPAANSSLVVQLLFIYLMGLTIQGWVGLWFLQQLDYLEKSGNESQNRMK